MDLIDADELAKKFTNANVSGINLALDKYAVKCIEDAPTIAQPEIIHCRDCRHYYFADNRIPQEQRYVCDIGGEIWQPDDFCSYGERREESNESKERP